MSVGVLQLPWDPAQIDRRIHQQRLASSLGGALLKCIHTDRYHRAFLFDTDCIPLSITIGQPQPEIHACKDETGIDLEAQQPSLQLHLYFIFKKSKGAPQEAAGRQLQQAQKVSFLKKGKTQ